MVSGILPTSSISVGNHGCDTGVRYASLFFDRCCGSRKKRSLPTPRGKISFFLRFDDPLSLRESRVLKSPYRNLKKTDTPVWVCPFAFIKFFDIQGYSALPHFSNAASVWRKIACARDCAVRSGYAPLRLLRRTPFASRKRGS